MKFAIGSLDRNLKEIHASYLELVEKFAAKAKEAVVELGAFAYLESAPAISKWIARTLAMTN